MSPYVVEVNKSDNDEFFVGNIQLITKNQNINVR